MPYLCIKSNILKLIEKKASAALIKYNIHVMVHVFSN